MKKIKLIKEETPRHELILNHRWYPLYLNPGAIPLEKNCNINTLITIPAGRRSGKTERFKRFIIKRGINTWLDRDIYTMEQNYFLSAPTYGQAKKIFWRDLKTMLKTPLFPESLREVSESELRVSLIHPANEDRRVTWWVFGMDKPERMEGPDWLGGGCDEFGDMHPEVYGECIQPALSTVGLDTFFWGFGVPEGRNHYYDLSMFNEKKQLHDNEYGNYTWHSSEVLPKSIIKKAKEILDPKTFSQQYEASWETKSGLVYYAWTAQSYPDGNIDNNVKYNNQLPVFIGMDFNVDPMTAVLKHHVINDKHQLESWVFDGYYLRNSNTKQMIERIISEYPDAPSYILTPCQSSSNRQTSQEIGKTDLRIIMDVCREHGIILRIAKRSRNPSQSDKHNVVNARLYHKLIRINCDSVGLKELVKDYEGLSYKPGSSEVDKRNSARGHISDALGYSEEFHFDIKSMIHEDSIPATNFM